MTITEVKVKEGGTRFVVNARVCGRRKRSYHTSRKDAESQSKEWLKVQRSHGDQFVALDDLARSELVTAWHSAKKYGFGVMEAVQAYVEQAEIRDQRKVTLGTAIRRCLREKKLTSKIKSYQTMSCTLEQFGEGRWNMPLDEVDRTLLINWLAAGRTARNKPWKTPTRNGYLINLKALFNWCVDEGLLDASPAAPIRKFKPSDKEIAGWESCKHILPVAEIEKLMAHFGAFDPELIPRISVAMFGGLRPEREACGCQWEHIDWDENVIYVPASNAKDRQRRYVPITPNLRRWLEWARQKGLSFQVSNWEKRWLRQRRLINLTGENWPHDGLRRSFASYNMAVHGEAATKEALGHGSFEMLFKHYRSAVKRSEGEAFFGIEPPRAK